MQTAKMSIIASTALLLLSGTGLTGCSLLPKDEEPLRPPLVKPAQETYNTVKAGVGTISKEFRGTATFESTKSEDAQFTTQGGRVEKVYVKAGDTVKKGDLLVQLTVDGLEMQVKEQNLNLERAKYAVKQAKDSDNYLIANLTLDIEQTKYNQILQTFNSKQLKAKMDGLVVFAEAVNPGDTVGAYQTLVRIADPTLLRLGMHADNSANLQDIEVGMIANVKLGSENVEGIIVQTPSSAPSTQNKDLADKYSRSLYLNLSKVPDTVKIGTNADFTIPLQKHEKAMKIPRSGLRTYNGRTFVQVLEGKGLREIDVETGIQSATEVEITKGLSEGQEVVLQS